MPDFYVYFLASRPGGAIYTGVTNDLVRRVHGHRANTANSHTKRFNIKQLVYFETYSNIQLALQREHNIKHWPRAWKTNLIAEHNPTWRDLYEEIGGGSSATS